MMDIHKIREQMRGSDMAVQRMLQELSSVPERKEIDFVLPGLIGVSESPLYACGAGVGLFVALFGGQRCALAYAIPDGTGTEGNDIYVSNVVGRALAEAQSQGLYPEQARVIAYTTADMGRVLEGFRGRDITAFGRALPEAEEGVPTHIVAIPNPRVLVAYNNCLENQKMEVRSEEMP